MAISMSGKNEVLVSGIYFQITSYKTGKETYFLSVITDNQSQAVCQYNLKWQFNRSPHDQYCYYSLKSFKIADQCINNNKNNEATPM